MPATATEPLAAMHSAIREQRRSRIRGRREKKDCWGGEEYTGTYMALHRSPPGRPVPGWPESHLRGLGLERHRQYRLGVRIAPADEFQARRARRPVPLRHDDAEACGDLGTQAAKHGLVRVPPGQRLRRPRPALRHAALRLRHPKHPNAVA